VSDRLRLALVGCGAISEWHRMAIAEVPEIEIAAAVDVDAGRAASVAKATGATAFTSLEAALASHTIDAVDLMLPHHLHESMAVQALEAGVHVLLEKPMAPTLEACDRILAASARSDRVFMVGENAQYWPEVLIAERLLHEGAIGDPVTARVQLFFPPMDAYYGGERAWRLDKNSAGGGVAIDTGSHYIRPLRMWLGEVEEVVAQFGRPYAQMQGESLVRALLRFPKDVVVSFDLLLTQAPMAPQEMFRLTGTRGEITIGLQVKLFNEENRRGVVVDDGVPQGYMRSYQGQFADFARASLQGTPLAAGPDSSLGELRTALAMERSMQSRRWEKVW
jgi:UDP-N-acetyl-2-amino-2-deoxyglucuronate dehydrogenase